MINSDFEQLVHILKENVDFSNVTDDYHKVLSLLKNDWLKR